MHHLSIQPKTTAPNELTFQIRSKDAFATGDKLLPMMILQLETKFIHFCLQTIELWVFPNFQLNANLGPCSKEFEKHILKELSANYY